MTVNLEFLLDTYFRVYTSRELWQEVAYLRLHKHQVNEEHHKIVLHVFVCKALTARALRQAYFAARRALLCFASSSCAFVDIKESSSRYGRGMRANGRRFGMVRACGWGGSWGSGWLGVAMEDVIELGNGIAALDADGHAAG